MKNNLDLLMKEVNNFLGTRKGLKYLLLKYPSLSLPEAIQEYKTRFILDKPDN